MKRKSVERFLVGFFIVISLLLLAFIEEADATEAYPGLCETGKGDLYTAAIIIREFGVDNAVRALRIASCESWYDPYAHNAETKAAGLFQFKPRTWGWVCEPAGVDCSINARYDAHSNIRAAAYLALKQSGGGWHHWECK